MLTTTRWRLLDRAGEFKRHLQLAANSAHHSPFFLFIHWYFLLALVSPFRSIFVESWMSNNVRTVLWVNLSWSWLQDNHKLQSNYKIRSRSKILRANRRPCPPVCPNWVNWPFREQHHAATHLDLASIFFSPQNITLAILPWSHLILTWFSQK